MRTKISALLVTVLFATVLTACGGSNKETSAGTDSGSASASSGDTSGGTAEQADFKKLGDEPLKLTFYSTGATFTDTEFNTLIADPIHKKYPNVTIERITPAATTTPEEVLSTHVPDIIFGSVQQRVIRTGVYQDLRELIKKHNFDLSRLKPIGINYIKEITKGDGDAILALPFNINQHIMYYNKDIFDKFGVPYPTDKQLTWDEAVELGAKLTRTENGVNYIGLAVDNLTGLSKSLGLPYLDRETGQAALDTPDWLRVFELQKKIFETPGYITPDGTWNWTRDHFMKDQNIAMRVSWLANMVGPLEELRQQGVEFNWDIAPAPTFSDHLGQTREAQIHAIAINSQSPHKDEAFQVIAEILSDDGQRIIARNGRVPAIINPDLEKEYGADIPVLQGKTVQNVFIGEPLQEHFIHPYESEISKRLTEAAEDLAIHGLDVNSAIRKATDAINKDVETLKTTIGQ
ncbi:multiple sugar transport system substrate-binding protein [Paenibacillus cellulosilyticus]|uniref:Multiple sugar transport system substrate-binding protein n=1 Tax=Paenibacillus cellulosilyticus TaxID=375489 RepID=A0A2V2YWN9_9BACL|nr:extracellular solute-binding protein [Paenibacillus cellulosilyticus]PWW06238.1 multiple sugar transport system substrate-binding protein [Paenibacillus cellulosilyticus]QKS43004.1 extracellular solute-binding protein [Paenibacillus cellulosilyticus]